MIMIMTQGLKVMMNLKIKYITMLLNVLYPVLSVVACCYNANCDDGKK